MALGPDNALTTLSTPCRRSRPRRLTPAPTARTPPSPQGLGAPAMKRHAAFLGALTLAATAWTAGAAYAAPPAPAGVHSTTFSAAQQSAALRFWTPERLRAAQDVTVLPSSTGVAATSATADAAGPEVAVPPVAAPGTAAGGE